MPDLKNTDVVIIKLEDGIFVAYLDGVKIGEGPSARRLRDRFIERAKEVKHEYDLREER